MKDEMNFAKNMKEQKIKVREKIREALIDFNKNTGAYVVDIGLLNHYTINKYMTNESDSIFDTTFVEIEVKG